MSIKKSDESDICKATIGRNQGKEKYVILDPDTCTDRDIYHEIFHAIGLLHEHQRSDRDDYITIKWENIPYGYNLHFAKLKRSKTLGLPYDITSIMHYSPIQGASPVGAVSIVSKVGTEILIFLAQFII